MKLNNQLDYRMSEQIVYGSVSSAVRCVTNILLAILPFSSFPVRQRARSSTSFQAHKLSCAKLVFFSVFKLSELFKCYGAVRC